jgi:tetratricopeptide (TPR) repeat protein
MLASVEKDLQKLIKKYPKTEVAKASYITLAELYLLDKKYGKAVEALDEFISMHSASTEDKDTVLLSRAHFLKAGAYEKLDREKEALAEFAILKEEFANTPLGLQTPLYIAHYHKREGREGVAEEEYNNAVEFYIELEEKNRKTMFGYAASNLLVQTYIALDKYEEAGKVVQDTISNYPSTMTLVQQLPYVELIYLKALNNPDKAIEIYSAILKNTKDPKIKKYLEEKIKGMIQSLNTKKQKYRRLTSMGKVSFNIVNKLYNPIDATNRFINLALQHIEEDSQGRQFLLESKVGIRKMAVLLKKLNAYAIKMDKELKELDEIAKKERSGPGITHKQ